MSLLWLGIVILLSVPVIVAGTVMGVYLYVRFRMVENLTRIFTEKPLFVLPRGAPRRGAEDVEFPSFDGLALRGCYIATSEPRKGVILFGLEFGSNRWSCQSYCEPLLEAGYDVFAFEPRNQGDSQVMEGYDPLHWLTSFEVADTQAAIAYLQSRDDADPKGIGFFGISKGANAGLAAAARNRAIRCIVTDGAFGTYTTMVPFMRKWVAIYDKSYLTHGLLPSWFYTLVAKAGVKKVQHSRKVRFKHPEKYMARLKRPLLMIHGGNDTYIKPEMARELFRRAAGPKAFWVVEGAKHNQALSIAEFEYSRRIVEFFDLHLAGIEPASVPVEAIEEIAPVLDHLQPVTA